MLTTKQIYIETTDARNYIKFTIKKFSSANAVFQVPNMSAANPNNGKLGFKLK